MSTANPNAGSPLPPPISDRAKLTLGVAAGALCVVMILWGLFKPSDRQPELKRSEYTEALQKWKAAGVKSYDLHLRLSGRGDQNSDVILEVRDGRVTKSLYNGKQESRKTAENWTIENQFKYIEEDLDKAEGPGFGVKEGVTITLHGEFDPKYGYPDHYFRQAHGPSPLQSQWKVTRFKVVDDAK